jgi:rieske iron-sulfur protein
VRERTCGGCLSASRRGVLAAASAFILDIATGGAWAEPADERPKAGDLLVRADGGAALTPADIAADAPPLAAWPMDPAGSVTRNGSRLNKVLVLRLDPQTLGETAKERAADGVLAYSAICPHAGCEITGWSAERKIIECPCHASHYDPRQAGAVIDGPTPRPLAGLPLKIADGKLVVAKPFTGRVGIIQN